MKLQKALEIKTVCGAVISNADQYPSAVHNNKKVYFCTKACLNAYQESPEQFIAGEIAHPLDED